MYKPLTPWEKCVAFHGHECPGLTFGYKAAMYAIELLGLTFSENENVVCVAENDACGVDAIQVLLGCSAGKGNLLFHIRGKHAFSFYERNSGKSIRLVPKPIPEGMSRDERFAYLQSMEPSEIFDVKEVTVKLPEPARLFTSHVCSCCGELTADNWLKVSGDKYLCLDCYESYDRFNV